MAKCLVVITKHAAAEPVSKDSATEISTSLRFSKSSASLHRSLTLQREPVQLGHDDGLHFASVDERQESLQSRPIQGFGGFPAVDDHIDQVCALHCGHRGDLCLLRLERNDLLRLAATARDENDTSAIRGGGNLTSGRVRCHGFAH